jgi:membrane-associated protease RseP (regulator of RpoE activity)
MYDALVLILQLLLFLVVFVNLLFLIPFFLKAFLCKAAGMHVKHIVIGFGKRITHPESYLQICIFPVFPRLESDDMSRFVYRGREDVSLKQWLLSLVAIASPIPFAIFLSMVFMTISFLKYGDIPDSLQLTGVKEGSPAMEAGFKRGDIILKVQDKPVKKYEQGLKALGQYPGKTIDVEIERKSNYKSVSGYDQILSYLENKYIPRSYIWLFHKDSEVGLYYAPDEAIRHMKKLNPNGIRAEISTSREIRHLSVTPNSEGKIGIDVKLVTLPDKQVFLGPLDSMKLGSRYVLALTYEIALEFGAALTDLKSMDMSLNLLSVSFVELKWFLTQSALFQMNAALRVSVIVLLLFSVICMFPVPGSLFTISVGGLFTGIINSLKPIINESKAKKYTYTLASAISLLLLVLIEI